MRYVTGVDYDWTYGERMNYTINTSKLTYYGVPETPKERATTVKRRIYLFKDDDAVRAIALGFRETDAKAIAAWIDGANDSSYCLALDVDPAEVDVRWLTNGG